MVSIVNDLHEFMATPWYQVQRCGINDDRLRLDIPPSESRNG
jgi:hypothetical protein